VAGNNRRGRGGVKATARRPWGGAMRELVRTNDVVWLSWLQALLSDAGIEAIVLDTHASVLEGSISAIQRRLCVHADDYSRALRTLQDAGELGGAAPGE